MVRVQFRSGRAREFGWLNSHLSRARANGLSETALAEVIIHLAFYAGWPRAMSAVRVAREALKK